MTSSSDTGATIMVVVVNPTKEEVRVGVSTTVSWHIGGISSPHSGSNNSEKIIGAKETYTFEIKVVNSHTPINYKKITYKVDLKIYDAEMQ